MASSACHQISSMPWHLSFYWVMIELDWQWLRHQPGSPPRATLFRILVGLGETRPDQEIYGAGSGATIDTAGEIRKAPKRSEPCAPTVAPFRIIPPSFSVSRAR